MYYIYSRKFFLLRQSTFSVLTANRIGKSFGKISFLNGEGAPNYALIY